MRAVNCAVRRGNKYIGENADGKGFLMSLEGVVDARGKRIVLFGAGGAARAIGVGLALAGAHSISVVNRTAERGMELVQLINENTPSGHNSDPPRTHFIKDAEARGCTIVDGLITN